MSRCFPFPPPGYEKKARPDGDANLLIKESHKDKKQKKDKKDKEKKERRDKEKERSSEKHKEKKERKHKHKDKEDKNRDKEEKKVSEEKKTVALSDHQNSEKFGQTGIQVGENCNSRHFHELGKKVRNDDGAKETQIVKRNSTTDICHKSPGKVMEHNLSTFTEGNQKTKGEENRILNGQCVKVNGIGLANGFVSILPAKLQKNVGGSNYQEGKVTEKQKEPNDTNKQKNSDARGDKHTHRDREKKSKSKDKKRKKEKEKEKKGKEEKVEFSSPMPSNLRESGNSAIDSKNDRGSYLFKESNETNDSLSKRKEPNCDGILNGNEVQNYKLARPVSFSHQVIQNGSRIGTSNSGLQLALKKEVAVQNHKSNSKVSSSISVVQNGRTFEMRQTAINFAPERQEVVRNHNKANDNPSSLKPILGDGRNLDPCQTVTSFSAKEQVLVTNHVVNKNGSSSQTLVENGRKLESSQINNLTAAEKQETVCRPKFSGKDSRIRDSRGPELDKRASNMNGLVKRECASLRSPSAPGQLKEIVERRVKSPHPDAKYLSEILSVPKVEWSDVDDQNWLFSNDDHQAKKPKTVSTTEESKQVWAEVLEIESADVTALPYVIPY